MPLSVGNLEPSPSIEARIDRPGAGAEECYGGGQHGKDHPVPPILRSGDRIRERRERKEASGYWRPETCQLQEPGDRHAREIEA
jgi:hypothetical protein